jgi:outer membrane protein TolC
MYKYFLLAICFCLFIIPTLYANADQRELTFAQAADLAIAASIDLRHSRSSQALMRGAWRWGARAYFPRFNFNVSENDRLQQLGADSFIKSYNLSVEQQLWDGGRTFMSRNLERMELNLSSSRLDRMALEIAEAAIAAYRNVLSSRTILEIRNAALNILEEQRNILFEEVQLGLALPIDLASADINIADARIDIFSIQLDLFEMERQFAELLGLKVLPVLTEKVDINRSIVLPAAQAMATLAREKNPELIEARYSITKKQAELRYVSNLWLPTLRLTGDFALSGNSYPLTRYNWSVGISVDFSSPMFQNRFSAKAGWEPASFGQHDRTAMLQNSFTPLPDPAASYGRHQAKVALSLEQEKYNATLDRLDRIAANAVDKYNLANHKRNLSIEASVIAAERYRIEEIRLNLGQITRLRLMEVLIEQTQREIIVVQAATALLEAERELERFLDLQPGELAAFAANNNAQRRNQ